MLEAILATEPVIRNRHRWTPALLQHHFGARAQITEHQLPNEALNLADGTSPASKSAPPQKSYVHLNPARARLLKGGQPLEEFPWSSYGDYLRPGHQRPGWLRVDRLLGEKGIPRDSAAGRREFARLTEQRRRADLAQEFKPVERGWCLGSEAFRQELLAAVGSLHATHYGAERREVQTSQALELLRAERQRLGWDRAALRRASKGDERKVRLAVRIRQETTMSLKWIAEHLAMGSWTHVSNLLVAERKRESLKSEN